MIQKSVAFALQNRFLVLCAGILALIWGAISFKQLPVEAYPDVANNYVQVITQWPGRAAEEVEQQVTIPIEVQMNGLPQLVSLRSWSLAERRSFIMLLTLQRYQRQMHRNQARSRVVLAPRSFRSIPTTIKANT